MKYRWFIRVILRAWCRVAGGVCLVNKCQESARQGATGTTNFCRWAPNYNENNEIMTLDTASHQKIHRNSEMGVVGEQIKWLLFTDPKGYARSLNLTLISGVVR